MPRHLSRAITTIVITSVTALALMGCRMPVEGCYHDESSTGDEVVTTIDVPPGFTSADTATATTVGASASGSSSTSSTSDDGGSSDDGSGSTTAFDLDTTESSSESSDASSSEETGAWEGYDEAHCDAVCGGAKNYDPVPDACICAPLCEDDGDCGDPAVCLDGQCGIPCVDNGSCPYNTVPQMVCGALMNGTMACMYWTEGP